MNKKVLIIIAIVIIIVITGWLVYSNLNKPQEVDTNIIDTNALLANTVEENVVNELEENTEITQNKEELVDEPEEEKKEEPKKPSTSDKKDNEGKNSETISGTSASREEKAVKLVKEAWGDTKGVSITYQGIDNSGKYIVTVNDLATSRTLAFYKVDINKGTVEATK